MSYFRFELIHQSKKSRARVGRIHTPHGIIDTPNFVAVGTNGTLKAIDNVTANTLGSATYVLQYLSSVRASGHRGCQSSGRLASVH